MRTPFQGAAFIADVRATVAKYLVYTIQIASLVVFLFMSAHPHYALAFANDAAYSQQPLRFIRDPDLATTTVIGLEASPTTTPASTVAPVRVSLPPPAPGTTLQVVASAYSSTADQTDGNPFATASGTHVHQGTLAANFLPFGAQVRINGYVYTVEDRLHARFNGTHRVDIWHPTRHEALAFGLRAVDMEILSLPLQ